MEEKPSPTGMKKCKDAVKPQVKRSFSEMSTSSGSPTMDMQNDIHSPPKRSKPKLPIMRSADEERKAYHSPTQEDSSDFSLWRWGYVTEQDWHRKYFGERQGKQSSRQSLLNDIKNHAKRISVSIPLDAVIKSIIQEFNVKYTFDDTKDVYRIDLDYHWRLMLTQATCTDPQSKNVIVAHVFKSTHHPRQNDYDTIIACRGNNHDLLQESLHKSFRIEKTNITKCKSKSSTAGAKAN